MEANDAKVASLRAAEIPRSFAPCRAQPSTRLNSARALLEGASEKGFGPRTAYHCNGRTFTYADVHREVHRHANALRRLGVGEGEAVLLRREDTAELIFNILAVHAIGAIAVPTYTQLRTPDLAYRINDSGAKVVIVDAALLAEAEPLLNECVSLSHLVVAPADPTGRFVSLDSLLEDDAPRVDYADTHADDVALILYTSGSTGHPRPPATITRIRWRPPTPTPTTASECGPATSSPARPRSHSRSGSTASCSTRCDRERQPSRCRQDAATADRGDGRVRRHHRRRGFDLLHSAGPAHLRARIEAAEAGMALCGGEPLPIEVERAWASATGVPLEQFLGTTELLNIFIGVRHGVAAAKPGAMGRAVPGYEISVRDADTFAPVPSGTAGLLCVRGPTGTHYLNNAEAQAKTVRDGWNVFQDLVAWDEDGSSFISRAATR